VARETVLESFADGVRTLVWNRPRRKNAFDEQMWRESADALREARSDERVRALVVTGSGEAFSAGQDLGEMAQPPAGGDGPGFPRFMDELVAFDKPLLAAVNGVGVGIGLTFLLHCDVVWIADEARLRAPFVPLGVVPEAASSYLLPLQLGHQRAAELLYTAEWIDAARAVDLGLASRALPRERLLPELQALATRIAAQPLGALRHTKRLLMVVRAEGIRGAREREDAAFRVRVGSPENVEALKAFLEKRPADFRQVPASDRGA
jgi:enoyl-CoA hydratase/carnithine racemase